MYYISYVILIKIYNIFNINKNKQTLNSLRYEI